MHYRYVLSTIASAGIEYELSHAVKQIGGTAFEMFIEGELLLMDFSDFPEILPNYGDYPYYFKFHFSEDKHEQLENIFPFTPISFDEWNQYARMTNEICYSANDNIILNNQRPYAGARERRKKVQRMLTSHFRNNVDTSLTSQESFWKKINNCLVSVCVPGARNDMLDRGQLQYMALGCCTVSPKLLTVLPYSQQLIPGTHYVQCDDDYSDLIEKIEWCKANREDCVTIGKNAKQLFLETCTPHKLWDMVNHSITCRKQLAY